MFHRLIQPPQRSFFLLGPRGSGKSTWLKKEFGDSAFFVDLLDLKTQTKLIKKPESLAYELQTIVEKKKPKWVVIDEIQKIPQLLDTVQSFIDKKQFCFALSGSSARKLKRGGANLLGGRAFERFLFPLISSELKDRFDLSQILNFGSLPEVFQLKRNEEKCEYLDSYTQLYLKEEIQEEQLVRKLPPFHLFIEIAAQMDGKIINYSRIADDVGVDTKTIISYFQILEETLIGFLLPSYHPSIRKRQKLNPKFYFFDLGVRRAVENSLGSPLVEKTTGWGRAFESWVINEIYRRNKYFNLRLRLSYLWAAENSEIDLILERPDKKTILLEIKSRNEINERNLIHLTKFRDSFANPSLICLSNDPVQKIIKGVHCYPWREWLDNELVTGATVKSTQS